MHFAEFLRSLTRYYGTEWDECCAKIIEWPVTANLETRAVSRLHTPLISKKIEWKVWVNSFESTGNKVETRLNSNQLVSRLLRHNLESMGNNFETIAIISKLCFHNFEIIWFFVNQNLETKIFSQLDSRLRNYIPIISKPLYNSFEIIVP